jgi:hypothetical protein
VRSLAPRDLDLLCHGNASPDALAGLFRDVCQIAEDDGVAFDAKSIDAEPIREHRTYVGVRVVLRAAVDQARVRVQVDVGFGDAVDPPAERATFPALLDAPAPVVMVYRARSSESDAHYRSRRGVVRSVGCF